MNLLEVKHVSRRFGSLAAVADVSMTVAQGELRAVIGPNGAGKTTFFNLISGYITPTAGRIFLDERDITRMPPSTAMMTKLPDMSQRSARGSVKLLRRA